MKPEELYALLDAHGIEYEIVEILKRRAPFEYRSQRRRVTYQALVPDRNNSLATDHGPWCNSFTA